VLRLKSVLVLGSYELTRVYFLYFRVCYWTNSS